ncbi:MAG TPA: flagellar biosynthetic protein FliR [Candidatus Binatia bacterium]|nr:flagellar biosynthetic protein FliR [Candidatus Binatia bacterium]
MVSWLLVFARCAGFVFRAPGFSHPSAPSSLRVGFAAVLALAIARHVGRVEVHNDSAFICAVATEFLLGGVIGMTASLAYDGAYAGGRIVDDYVGVRAIAPNLQLVAPSGFGRVWSLVFTGGFFLTGAYRPVVWWFAQSFDRIPPGLPLHAGGWVRYAGEYAATIVYVAAQIAMPAVAGAFVVQIALGALSRVVPRFGSFTLTFPLAFAAALIATAIVAPLGAERAPGPELPIPK